MHLFVSHCFHKKSKIFSVANFPRFGMNFQLFILRFFSSGFDSNRNNILKSSSAAAANDKYENYNDDEEEESDDELEEERRKRRARRQQRAAARGLAKNIERYIDLE